MSTDHASYVAIPITVLPVEYAEEVRIPASANNWEGFRAWAVSDDYPDRGKITFADGELIIDMSPESFEEQGAVKTEVSRVLAQLVRDRKLGHYRIDGTLISNKDAGLSSEPDSVFVSHAALKSGRAQLVPAVGRPQSSKEILGSVDWVLEIVSPSSRRKDSSTLRDLYFRAGILEYWLIDVLGEDVDFQILVPDKTGYRSVAAVDGMFPSPTFGASFRLVRERTEEGFWEYTLEMK
jgi:Uma2 family endonuclease